MAGFRTRVTTELGTAIEPGPVLRAVENAAKAAGVGGVGVSQLICDCLRVCSAIA
jgi:hypothetical protein